MFFNIFKQKNLKDLLRENDNVLKIIKSEFLKQYTLNCMKISKLKKRGKTPAVTKHIKFLKNSNSSELVKLYKYYKIASNEEQLKILGILEKMERHRAAINLSVTIDNLTASLK